MRAKNEQRVCVKFCVKLSKSFTETFQMLQEAFGDECMSRSRCHEWYRRFCEGRTSEKDDSRLGRPSTSTDDDHVAKVNALIRADRRLTIREIAEECEISFGSCQEILTGKLEMRRVAAKFVPKVLTEDQKGHRVLCSEELLEQATNDENFLKRIITGDETWVFGYDVETKVITMEVKKLSQTQKSSTSQVKSEGHVDSFL